MGSLHKLCSPSLELTVDLEYGTIVAAAAPGLNWQILDRPELGCNFEMTIPLPDKHKHIIDGSRQKPASAEAGEDFVELFWNRIETPLAGVLEIALTLRIERKGRGFRFLSSIKNGSPYTVDSLCFPRLGDVALPEGAAHMDMHVPAYSDIDTQPVYPHFLNAKGYWGVDVPTQMAGGPSGAVWPFAFLDCDNSRGLYFSADWGEPRYLLYRLQQFPGYISTHDWRVPQDRTADGNPCHRLLDFPHLPFCRPGGEMTLTPVYLEAYEGDWITAADIYKRLKAGWNWAIPAMPDWLNQPHAWLQLQLNGSEDDLRIRYTELPRVARQCLEAGITAIQLVGWNYGGQDRGNPRHDVDPRLGTWEELKESIAACREMGVHIILFSKFTWADILAEGYEEDFHPYVMRDGNGIAYRMPGFQYQTITQLQDLNTRRFSVLCFGSRELRAKLKTEFDKLVALGADGTLYDECQHKGNAHLCFDDRHGHEIGQVAYAWDNTLISEFKADAPASFLFAGEANYDGESQQYHLVYYRTNTPLHRPVKAYINRTSRFMTAVIGFDDREMVNQCLLFQYIPSYEPYFFKGLPADMPKTIAYGKQMMELRRETAAYTWYGDMLLEREASVLVNGEPYTCRYCVYRAGTGKRAVVIINNTLQDIYPEVTLDNGRIQRYKAIGGEWVEDDRICVPARGAVVALEA